MAIPKVARDAIRKQEETIRLLTNDIVSLEAKLEESRGNDDTYSKLLSFAKKIAETKSKFAAEAREILNL